MISTLARHGAISHRMLKTWTFLLIEMGKGTTSLILHIGPTAPILLHGVVLS